MTEREEGGEPLEITLVAGVAITSRIEAKAEQDAWITPRAGAPRVALLGRGRPRGEQQDSGDQGAPQAIHSPSWRRSSSVGVGEPMGISALTASGPAAASLSM